MSESTEMYLLRIALLRESGRPVSVGRLAAALGISPVSANQMCHRLAAQGLVEYRPYRGLTLSAAGEERAGRLLHRRRLWETFLVERLGLAAAAAEAAACQLEHATTDDLAERLAAFLGQAEPAPCAPPIPRQDPAAPSPERSAWTPSPRPRTPAS